ncbi:hypothetical protein Thi970DRAFT_00786 [Thiorhodovibrio frisius]|uniref:Hemerythrin-like domain-containing protein n=2 Tax=Thiorhodovibrio frisius TaxID=631362 RepID=H8YXF8_9GAMM|nr:hypothetical protein Thi970DRAFT_00786 [Thiorhodovibrio frisius]WPL22602.1 hypothetical protein Thiofri_02769 [Thiorhodovibrio frisius]
MSALMNRLTRDHRRFARIMALLDALVARFQGGDEPDYELMCEMLEYVVDYADQVHHPSEELIFTALRQGLGATASGPEMDPSALALAITELSDQHRQLEDTSRAFRDALEGIVHGEVLSRDAVAGQGQALIALMRSHIADEEARVFPVARTMLSADDWSRLEQQAPSAADPVFGQLDPLRFRTLYDYLKDEIDPEDAA